MRVCQPEFLLVRRQSNAVARASVPFGRALFNSLHFDTMQHFAGRQVADFKPKQVVEINKTERPATVDREGPDKVAERPNLTNHLVRLCLGHGQQWRA